MLNISLLTIAVFCIIFLAAFLRLWKTPPVVVLNFAGLTVPPIPSDMTIRLTQQIVPADVEVKSKDEPIPEDILDYISQESEPHAQDARKRRVRMLKIETGGWDSAFRLLQREDSGDF